MVKKGPEGENDLYATYCSVGPRSTHLGRKTIGVIGNETSKLIIFCVCLSIDYFGLHYHSMSDSSTCGSERLTPLLIQIILYFNVKVQTI